MNSNKGGMMKRKHELSDEVKSAVDDLLNGVTTSTSSEWLQREYIRLMRRECSYKKSENESKLKTNGSKVNGEHSEQNRTN